MASLQRDPLLQIAGQRSLSFAALRGGYMGASSSSSFGAWTDVTVTSGPLSTEEEEEEVEAEVKGVDAAATAAAADDKNDDDDDDDDKGSGSSSLCTTQWVKPAVYASLQRAPLLQIAGQRSLSFAALRGG